MRPRPSPHADAVSRRLELLSAELNVAEPAPDLHTHIRTLAPPDMPEPESLPIPAQSEDRAPVAVIRAPGRHAARRRTPVLPSVLPEAWRGRVALGPGPVAVVAVLVALGLALTTWWVLRGQAEPVDPAPAPPALATPLPVGASPSASASGSAELVVDVAGKVRRPGIAVLKPGARVIDAIRAAGGVRKGASMSGLNLARLLVDGEQIVVGIPPPPGVAVSAAGNPTAQAGALVNINTATAAQLEELPGVGPVTAESIIAFRTEHGAFTSVDELLDVSGIGDATLAEIAPHVTL